MAGENAPDQTGAVKASSAVRGVSAGASPFGAPLASPHGCGILPNELTDDLRERDLHRPSWVISPESPLVADIAEGPARVDVETMKNTSLGEFVGGCAAQWTTSAGRASLINCKTP